jgi:hypothetical protein
LAHGDIGFLEWTATCQGMRVDDGVDTYLVRDRWITVQTIHYTVSSQRER